MTSQSGVRATIAHVNVHAHPILSQPAGGNDEDMTVEDEVDGDGSSIMGRAANIASTAKDLLGALWYGANEESGRTTIKGSFHRRGSSLG